MRQDFALAALKSIMEEIPYLMVTPIPRPTWKQPEQAPSLWRRIILALLEVLIVLTGGRGAAAGGRIPTFIRPLYYRLRMREAKIQSGAQVLRVKSGTQAVTRSPAALRAQALRQAKPQPQTETKAPAAAPSAKAAPSALKAPLPAAPTAPPSAQAATTAAQSVTPSALAVFKQQIAAAPFPARQPQQAKQAADIAGQALVVTNQSIAQKDIPKATNATALAVDMAVVAQMADPGSASANAANSSAQSSLSSLNTADPAAVSQAGQIAAAALMNQIAQEAQNVGGMAIGTGTDPTAVSETTSNVLAGNYAMFDPVTFMNLGVINFGPTFTIPGLGTRSMNIDLFDLSFNTGIPFLGIGISDLLGTPNPFSVMSTLKSMVSAINFMNDALGYPHGSLFGQPTAFTYAQAVATVQNIGPNPNIPDPTLLSAYLDAQNLVADLNSLNATLSSALTGQTVGPAGHFSFTLTAQQAQTAVNLGISTSLNLSGNPQGPSGSYLGSQLSGFFAGNPHGFGFGNNLTPSDINAFAQSLGIKNPTPEVLSALYFARNPLEVFEIQQQALKLNPPDEPNPVVTTPQVEEDPAVGLGLTLGVPTGQVGPPVGLESPEVGLGLTAGETAAAAAPAGGATSPGEEGAPTGGPAAPGGEEGTSPGEASSTGGATSPGEGGAPGESGDEGEGEGEAEAEAEAEAEGEASTEEEPLTIEGRRDRDIEMRVLGAPLRRTQNKPIRRRV